jgi:hypothetical protein
VVCVPEDLVKTRLGEARLNIGCLRNENALSKFMLHQSTNSQFIPDSDRLLLPAPRRQHGVAEEDEEVHSGEANYWPT